MTGESKNLSLTLLDTNSNNRVGSRTGTSLSIESEALLQPRNTEVEMLCDGNLGNLIHLLIIKF